MNKDIKYFEIDISHLVYDFTDSDGNYYQFKNSEFGFKLLSVSVSASFIGIWDKGICRKPFIGQTIYLDEIIKN
jgi:hypothetical protein